MKVLFVCLGNICRSPMAEGIFLHLIEEQGIAHTFEVDSAGTSAYHIGEKADSRMRQTAQSHGIKLVSRSRQATVKDFSHYDYIIAMDESNYRNLETLQSKCDQPKAQLKHMLSYLPNTPDGLNVPDPYYGGAAGFEHVFQLLYQANEAFLNEIKVEK